LAGRSFMSDLVQRHQRLTIVRLYSLTNKASKSL